MMQIIKRLLTIFFVVLALLSYIVVACVSTVLFLPYYILFGQNIFTKIMDSNILNSATDWLDENFPL